MGILKPQKYNFGTLGDYWKTHFKVLWDSKKISEEDYKLLKASYKYLTAVIRNRDAHSYVKNVRREDFPAVEPIFVPAFNVLLKTMTKNKHFEA